MRANRYTFGCVVLAGLILGAGATQAIAGPVTYGPTPYAQRSDSPFDGLTFTYFYLENFESHALSTPGVGASAGQAATVQFGSNHHDSVDEDDGAVDGVVSPGTDSFYALGDPGVSFDFDAAALGGLPTHVGIVWTDGLGEITFNAYGPGNQLIGTIGPVSEAGVFPDDTVAPQPGEDRFFGISNEAGITRISLSNTIGGIEMDHLQYGRVGTTPPSAIPLPAAVWPGMMLLTALGVESVRRARRATASA